MTLDTPVRSDRPLARLTRELGAEIVSDDARGWTIDGHAPGCVIAPRTVEQVLAAVRLCVEEGLALVPWGGGTRVHVGAPPRAYDVALSLARLDRIVRHDAADLTMTAEAGLTIGALNARAHTLGQHLPVDVPFAARATIGGTVAAATDGPRTGLLGSVRALVLGATFVTGTGMIAHAGGRVVKNVTGYDVHRLLVRSRGALAVLTQVHLRLAPLPAARVGWALRAGARADAERITEALRTSITRPSAVMTLSPGHAALVIPEDAADAQPASTLFASSVSPRDAAAWWVLVAWDGTLEEVAAARAAAEKSVLGGVATDRLELADAVNESMWARAGACLAGEAGDVETVQCAITIPPAAGSRVLAPVLAACEQQDAEPHVAWHADRGLIALRCARVGEHAIDPILEELRAIARACGGHCIAERLPAHAKTPERVWGEDSAATPLMRRVKAAFDPREVLSPGRLIGGI